MNDLGNLQSVHKIQWQSKVVVIVFGFLLIVFAGLFVVWLFADESLATKKNGFFLVILISVCSVGSLMTGVFMIREFFRTKNEEVRLYENGFIYSTKKTIHIIKWEEIESVKESVTQMLINGFPARKLYSYEIKTQNDNKITIGNLFNKIEKIGERLKAETFNRRLPIVLEDFVRGKTIDFEKLKLNQNYISVAKGKTLPLSDFWRIDIETGKIRIFKKDGCKIWDTFDYKSIPNAPILITILSRI